MINETEIEVEVKEVVFTEENGRVYRVKLGLKLEVCWLDTLCKGIIDDLYHLEKKPKYSFIF